MHCISPVSSQLYMCVCHKDYFIAYLITYSWYTTLLTFFVQKNPAFSILLICTTKIDTTNRISIAIVNEAVCSRSQCRLTGHCTVMLFSTCDSLHQSPTSRPDKDFGLPSRTICAFLPSDCLLLDVVLSLSLALVFGTLFLPTSLQHLLCSLSENV